MQLRLDDTGFSDIKIWQDPKSFCYGVDAVLLADFAFAGKNDICMDLGTGNGIVPLIMYAKYQPRRLFGMELQPAAAKLAEKNAEYNGLSDGKRGSIFKVINDDILNALEYFEAGTFDVVTANPPYTQKGAGPVSSEEPVYIARHETTAGLSDFFSAAARLLHTGGHLYMIHRPSRLVDLLAFGRSFGLEAKEMRLVLPHEGETPNIVLLHFVKGAGKELKILPSIAVRRKEGGFTPEIEKIYGRL